MFPFLIDLLHLEDGVLRFVGAPSSKYKLLICFYDGCIPSIYFPTCFFIQAVNSRYTAGMADCSSAR